jgi:hypothetical protein
MRITDLGSAFGCRFSTDFYIRTVIRRLKLPAVLISARGMRSLLRFKALHCYLIAHNFPAFTNK